MRGSQNSCFWLQPELIFAALCIDKAFRGAQYAGYVLLLASLYFPAASLLGLVQPVSAGAFGNVSYTLALIHTHAQQALCPYLCGRYKL